MTLVSDTNAEADAINDAIQQRGVDQGELDVRVAAWGMAQQRILVGDTVQTRRNDRLTGVENRAQWIVRGIRDEHVSLVSVSDSGEVARVSTVNVREHLQLAYASTVNGVQGDTADASVGAPDVDAAGLYVGLTRGRLSNVAVVVSGPTPRPASASPSRCSAALRSSRCRMLCARPRRKCGARRGMANRRWRRGRWVGRRVVCVGWGCRYARCAGRSAGRLSGGYSARADASRKALAKSPRLS
ncbi:hypothetical protein [Microbacterium arborescens]|uniref:hypothetical protein n=1 Tax=Microbacterium arborescens TaxID=33883 RepID=UPI002788FF97|nr:hypothetical protein [Microbacterium arborescens]MDQ1215820.1 hypothetical protein [Microbacterium arborescens]